jgi:ABC-2 type transport system ATP-binding protein
LIDVRLAQPIAPAPIDGVTVLDAGTEVLRLSVDTSRTSVRAALDVLLDQCPVTDISVSDPPLEQAIAAMYEARGR